MSALRTTPTTSTAKPASKKKKASADEVADAFARGEVTLGTALGVTTAQKDVMRQRAFALLGEQRLDLAEPLLEGLVALDPFDAWTLTALAGLKLDRGGDATLALRLLDRAVDVVPGDVTARALRAEARARLGQVSAARDDLARLAGADPNAPAVRRARALEAAIKDAVDGVALPASSPTSRDTAAAGARKSRAKLR